MAERARPLPIRTEVASVRPLTRSLLRVELTAADWSGFGDPQHADAYVKLIFLADGVAYPRPIDPARIRAELPAAAWPRMRTYTVRGFDRAAGRLTLDVVVHGEAGLAAQWARRAQPGDEIHLAGPGGGYTPDAGAAWHLLAGDESALPAVAVALERMPADAVGAAFVEVEGAADQLELDHPDRVRLHWVYRHGTPVGERLIDAVRGWDQPVGAGQCFVHGEAGAVRTLRRHLRVERALPAEALSVSGYWRLGADDEGWRAVKREWNAAIEQTETELLAG